MKLSIKDFLSKCDQIRSFLRIWLHLLKKSLMENFIFYAVLVKGMSESSLRKNIMAKQQTYENAKHTTIFKQLLFQLNKSTDYKSNYYLNHS